MILYHVMPIIVNPNHINCMFVNGSQKKMKLHETINISFTMPKTKHAKVDVIFINCAIKTFSVNHNIVFNNIICHHDLNCSITKLKSEFFILSIYSGESPYFASK